MDLSCILHGDSQSRYLECMGNFRCLKLHHFVLYFFSPPVQIGRWAHMHRFLSVRLFVCPSGLDQK